MADTVAADADSEPSEPRFTDGGSGYGNHSTGGKLARGKRHSSRSTNPYSRPATGRHAAAGVVASATVNAVRSEVNRSLAGQNAGTDANASRGWLSGIGSTFKSIVSWTWGASPAIAAGAGAAAGSAAAGTEDADDITDVPSQRDEAVEDADQPPDQNGLLGSEESAGEKAGPSRRRQAETLDVSDFEVLLNQRASEGLSQDEYLRLTKLLQSKVKSSHPPGVVAGFENPARQPVSVASPPASTFPVRPANFNSTQDQDALAYRSSGSPTERQPDGYAPREEFFTPPSEKLTLEGASPVDIARAFMGERSGVPSSSPSFNRPLALTFGSGLHGEGGAAAADSAAEFGSVLREQPPQIDWPKGSQRDFQDERAEGREEASVIGEGGWGRGPSATAAATPFGSPAGEGEGAGGRGTGRPAPAAAASAGWTPYMRPPQVAGRTPSSALALSSGWGQNPQSVQPRWRPRGTSRSPLVLAPATGAASGQRQSLKRPSSSLDWPGPSAGGDSGRGPSGGAAGTPFSSATGSDLGGYGQGGFGPTRRTRHRSSLYSPAPSSSPFSSPFESSPRAPSSSRGPSVKPGAQGYYSHQRQPALPPPARRQSHATPSAVNGASQVTANTSGQRFQSATVAAGTSSAVPSKSSETARKILETLDFMATPLARGRVGGSSPSAGGAPGSAGGRRESLSGKEGSSAFVGRLETTRGRMADITAPMPALFGVKKGKGTEGGEAEGATLPEQQQAGSSGKGLRDGVASVGAVGLRTPGADSPGGSRGAAAAVPVKGRAPTPFVKGFRMTADLEDDVTEEEDEKARGAAKAGSPEPAASPLKPSSPSSTKPAAFPPSDEPPSISLPSSTAAAAAAAAPFSFQKASGAGAVASDAETPKLVRGNSGVFRPAAFSPGIYGGARAGNLGAGGSFHSPASLSPTVGIIGTSTLSFPPSASTSTSAPSFSFGETPAAAIGTGGSATVDFGALKSTSAGQDGTAGDAPKFAFGNGGMSFSQSEAASKDSPGKPIGHAAAGGLQFGTASLFSSSGAAGAVSPGLSPPSPFPAFGKVTPPSTGSPPGGLPPKASSPSKSILGARSPETQAGGLASSPVFGAAAAADPASAPAWRPAHPSSLEDKGGDDSSGRPAPEGERSSKRRAPFSSGFGGSESSPPSEKPFSAGAFSSPSFPPPSGSSVATSLFGLSSSTGAAGGSFALGPAGAGSAFPSPSSSSALPSTTTTAPVFGAAPATPSTFPSSSLAPLSSISFPSSAAPTFGAAAPSPSDSGLTSSTPITFGASPSPGSTSPLSFGSDAATAAGREGAARVEGAFAFGVGSSAAATSTTTTTTAAPLLFSSPSATGGFPSSTPSSATTLSPSPFTFGASSGLAPPISFTTGSAPAAAADPASAPSPFSFGASSTTTSTATPSPFSFGAPASSPSPSLFSLGTSSGAAAAAAPSTVSAPFAFGSAPSSSAAAPSPFAFGGTPASTTLSFGAPSAASSLPSLSTSAATGASPFLFGAPSSSSAPSLSSAPSSSPIPSPFSFGATGSSTTSFSSPFSFGAPSSSSAPSSASTFLFGGAAAASAAAPAPFAFGVAASPAPGANPFAFGAPSTASSAPSTPSPSAFTFGAGSTPFPAAAAAAPQQTFQFGGAAGSNPFPSSSPSPLFGGSSMGGDDNSMADDGSGAAAAAAAGGGGMPAFPVFGAAAGGAPSPSPFGIGAPQQQQPAGGPFMFGAGASPQQQQPFAMGGAAPNPFATPQQQPNPFAGGAAAGAGGGGGFVLGIGGGEKSAGPSGRKVVRAKRPQARRK